MTPEEERVLQLHRDLVAIPSLSHQEAAIADHTESILKSVGAEVWRVENNVIARAGQGPRLLFNSHFDTVSPGTAWTRDPFTPERVDGRVYGLGSNDAKASVAAMIAAFTCVLQRGGPCELLLLLVPEEETGGRGAELAWPAIQASGFTPEAVVVGEPTNLDIASAQKGLLILELIAEGDACHSANAAAVGARNPIRALARDLVALERLELAAEHRLLGKTTLEPTVLAGGERRNMVPARASVYLDIRTTPAISSTEIVSRVRDVVSSQVRVHSDRLRATETDSDALIVSSAKSARPNARVYGSRTMSDLVHFRGVPAIKCGPGKTERSHTADEFVLEAEVLAGARFYLSLVESFASGATKGTVARAEGMRT